MTASFDLDQLLLEALQDGPLDPPAATVDLAIAAARATPQRRPRLTILDRHAWPMPERARSILTATRRLAIVVAVALLVVAAAGALVAAGRLLDVRPEPFAGSTHLAVVATGEAHCWSIERVDAVAGGGRPLVDCAEWASLDGLGRWAVWRHLDAAQTSTILEVTDLRSGERREVTRAKDRGMIPGRFSPGGRYVTWDWCTTVTFPAECGGTAIADLSQTPATIVELPPGAMSLAWSPDDALVAIDDNESGVSIANGDGSARRVIGKGSFLAWSPDGGRFAIAVDEAVEIRALDGTSLSRIPLGRDRQAFAAWSPDGRMLAIQRGFRFGHSNDGPDEIWLVDLSTGRQETIALPPGCLQLPSFSGSTDTPGGCDGVEPAAGYGLVWSADSRHLAFALLPIGLSEPLVGVAIVDVKTGSVTRLDDGGMPAWSPDGRHLMFSTAEGVDVVESDGSHRHQVLDSPGRIDSKFGVWIPAERR